MNAMVDLLVEAQHEAIDAAPATNGYTITSLRHFASIEPENIREYRYAHSVVVHWRDADCPAGRTLREIFTSYAHESGTCLYSAFPSFVNVLAIGWDTAGVELPRGHHQPRPDYGNAYTAVNHDQALAAVNGYLFTGAAYVTVEWHAHGVWHQEVYVAEAVL